MMTENNGLNPILNPAAETPVMNPITTEVKRTILPFELTATDNPVTENNRSNPTLNLTTETPITNPITTEMRRIISPYDLTAADNSDAVISHPFLRETNYDGRSSSSGGRERGLGVVADVNTTHVNNAPHMEMANYVLMEADRDGVSGLNESRWRSIVTNLNAGKNKTNST